MPYLQASNVNLTRLAWAFQQPKHWSHQASRQTKVSPTKESPRAKEHSSKLLLNLKLSGEQLLASAAESLEVAAWRACSGSKA